MADLEALPENVSGEIIDGTLYVHPWHSPWLSHVAMGLLAGLVEVVRRRPGVPGEWCILRAPGVQAGGSPEFVPDLAGWRRERFPTLPAERFTEAPDWVCEILSPHTRAFDQRIKRPFYARIGVRYLWFLELEARTLTASQLIEGRWVELGVYGEDDVARVAPFGAIELKLDELWRW